MLFKPEKITSYDEINYRIFGMRMQREYEIISKGSVAEVSEYSVSFGNDRRTLERRVLCDNEMMIEILNVCGLMRWDGFSGNQPRGVLDGEMFTLSAIVNDRRIIRAQGSQNFPKNFPEFRREIDRILTENNSIM